MEYIATKAITDKWNQTQMHRDPRIDIKELAYYPKELATIKVFSGSPFPPADKERDMDNGLDAYNENHFHKIWCFIPYTATLLAGGFIIPSALLPITLPGAAFRNRLDCRRSRPVDA